MYYLVFALFYALSLLPFRLLYLISDGCYLIVYHVARYRRGVVRRHLGESFPDCPEREIRGIERGFYHWFCDYVVETVKMLSISPAQMRRHMVFTGMEVLDQATAQGKSCAVYLGHYCNWEWISSLQLWTAPPAQCAQIYHPLVNKAIDRLFLRLRGRWGSVSVPMADTLRCVVRYRRQGQPIVLGYIADQTPSSWQNIHHWLDFLHHDTPVLTGAEKIATATGQLPVYGDVRRVRRGYYECRFAPIQPAGDGPWPVTEAYFRLLEASIARDPAPYLWTHRRWKRTHWEYNLRLDPETGRLNTKDRWEDIFSRRGERGE